MNANVSLLSPLISLSACTWKNLRYQNAAIHNASIVLAFDLLSTILVSCYV